MHIARLAFGLRFTSAVGAVSAKPRLDIVIRGEINAGKIPGPGCSPARLKASQRLLSRG
jgi:hypothetical protein